MQKGSWLYLGSFFCGYLLVSRIFIYIFVIIFIHKKNNSNMNLTIKLARITCDVTQKELSDCLGINQSYLSKVENRIVSKPNKEKIMAEYLLPKLESVMNNKANELKELGELFDKLKQLAKTCQ